MIDRLACVRLCLLLFLTPIAVFSSPDQMGSPSPKQLLQQVEQLKAKLEALQTPATSGSRGAEDQVHAEHSKTLQLQRKLTGKFIFSDETFISAGENLSQARKLLADDTQTKAIKALNLAYEQYTQLLATHDLILRTVEADERAQQTHEDSKMYFMMRVRSDIPPKVLKAYGVMDLARQERDQGRFKAALEMWEQAEQMVKEGFDEHIAQMAEWRENARREAEVKRQRIKKAVDALLKDHFLSVDEGRFTMGSDSGAADERPAREVTVPAFKIGKTEVTFELYDYCVESSSCYSVPKDEGWGRGNQPVINVSYRDITRQFLPWLNKLTGQNFRLPSEAEWEYAARAGSQKNYTWGDDITCAMARYHGGTSVCSADDAANEGPAPVASYEPNKFGLYDVHGNVWEWVGDCWHSSYHGAPTDGSARADGNCAARGLRGGSWDYHKGGARLANRYYAPEETRAPGVGFRLVLED